MNTRSTFLATLTVLSITVLSYAAKPIDLSGRWAFELDPGDTGIASRWHERELAQSLVLPGSLQEQGFGDKPTDETLWTVSTSKQLLQDPRFADDSQTDKFRCPFWLTPDRHYVGVAWYQRQISIPENWNDQRVVLCLERAHWQTTVWVDNCKIGSNDSLGTPHIYDLTQTVKPGSVHRLCIRVDNSYLIPVGKDAHSVSDQTQSNWNGIIGRLTLKAEPKIWFENVQVYPDVKLKRISVRVRLGNHTGRSGRGILTVSAKSFNTPAQIASPSIRLPIRWTDRGAELTFGYEMGGECLLWDEYHPALYRLALRLEGDGITATDHASFGMRQLEVDDKQFTINSRKIFLRGTLECCIFPDHGYPPTDVAAWKRLIRIAQSHGLNHFRFHSWCPPDAAFAAADEEGFYLQVEGPCWATFGDGSAVDSWIFQECARTLRNYGNHPSFLLMSPSNEPHGVNCNDHLAKLVRYLKQQDSRHFYTAGTGWPQIDENEFHVQAHTRLQQWPTLKLDQPPQTQDDYREYVESHDVPVISHEIGQWCAYPDLTEDSQYTGVLKAENIGLFRDRLEKAGMGHLARQFLLASGRFQTLLYKQEIEAALRTPGFGGFQLLDLHDFPGHGTAPVGVLNAKWASKGYVTAREYRRFCNDVVPLARMDRRIFTSNERLEAAVDVANYGPRNLTNAIVQWNISTAQDKTVCQGRFGAVEIPTGGLTRVGIVRCELSRFEPAAKLNLEVKILDTPYANDWDVWVYPASGIAQDSVGTHLAEALDERAIAKLNQGERVLLVTQPHMVREKTLGTFQPIFWNRVTFPTQKVHTLGILCASEHSALAEFPTDTHANWQWQDLLEGCQPIVMDNLPANVTPIVQAIDDWTMCRKLGLVFEVRVGAGALVICSIDVNRDLTTRPAARQLRRSLLRYMASGDFHPDAEVTLAQLQELFREPTQLEKLGATATADNQHPSYKANSAIDADPATFWCTNWVPISRPPHHLVLDLGQPLRLSGLTYLPRQDMANGRIADFEVFVSMAGDNWGQPVASGTWPNDVAQKKVSFEATRQARFVKLVAISEVNGQPFAAVAEMDVIVE